MVDTRHPNPVLRTLSAATRRQVVQQSTRHAVRKGQTIFAEGAPAQAVWVVTAGVVYLVKRTPQGGTTTIFAITPAEGLCGVSALEHGGYAASAIAATDAELLRLPAAACAHLRQRDPRFAEALLRTCCQRLRQMAEAVSVARAPVEQRLAYALLRLQATFGLRIPITHQELARMAGMRRRGWIASARGQLTILHPEALREALNGTG